MNTANDAPGSREEHWLLAIKMIPIVLVVSRSSYTVLIVWLDLHTILRTPYWPCIYFIAFLSEIVSTADLSRITNDRGFRFERNCVLRRWQKKRLSKLSKQGRKRLEDRPFEL